MFWKFNLLTSSKIDSLLEKEDITLKELMEEEDILQECKAQNKKLVDFLSKKESLEQLMNLIVKEPGEDEDEKVRYKYPNIACELLTSDVNQINDSLADSSELLNQLYAFLEIDSPLNPLLASFFSKVMGLLITRKPDVFVNFLKERGKETLIPQILHHLSTSAIMDLLLRIVTCIESPPLRLSMLEWLNDQNLVRKLVGLIDVQVDEERQYNSAQALSDIVRLSREQMSQMQDKADPDPLLAAIESQDTVEHLLSHIIHDEEKTATSESRGEADHTAHSNDLENRTSIAKVDNIERRRNEDQAVINGVSVILALLEFKKPSQDNSEQLTQLDAERLAHGVSNVLLALQPRLKDIQDLLRLEPPPSSPAGLDLIQAETACNQRPARALGQARLSIVKLFKSLIDTNTYTINATIAQIKTQLVLMDLVREHPHNNFLHTQVEQCITSVLNNGPTTENGMQCHPLLDQLFEEGAIFKWILKLWDENEECERRESQEEGADAKKASNGQRKGFMGHIIRLANQIVQSMEKGTNKERMETAFLSLDEELRTTWADFLSSSLNPTIKDQNEELGGHLGQLASSSEDEDADFPIPFNEESALQQAFYDYQMQQLTSTFIDQFGFTADKFSGDDEKPDAPFEKLNRVNLDIQSSSVGANGRDDDEDDEDEERRDSATLFEQICSDRANVDGDSDEEDAWEGKEVTFAACVSQRTSGKSGPSSIGDSMNNNKQNGSKRKKLGPPLGHQKVIEGLDEVEIGVSADSSDEDEMDDDSEDELTDSPQVIRQTKPGDAAEPSGKDDEEDDDDDEMWDKLSADRLKAKGLPNGDSQVIVEPLPDSEPWKADFSSFESGAGVSQTETPWTPNFEEASFETTTTTLAKDTAVVSPASKAPVPAVPVDAWSTSKTFQGASASTGAPFSASQPPSLDSPKTEEAWADFSSIPDEGRMSPATAAWSPGAPVTSAKASPSMEPPLPVIDLAVSNQIDESRSKAYLLEPANGPSNGPTL